MFRAIITGATTMMNNLNQMIKLAEQEISGMATVGRRRYRIGVVNQTVECTSLNVSDLFAMRTRADSEDNSF